MTQPKIHQTKLGPFQVAYLDKQEYHALKREIFTEDIYHLDLETSHPLFLDLGAHLGLASLYFAHRFPAARVLAVEPHPVSFQLLQENIWHNRLDHRVSCLQAAVTPGSQPTTTLHADPEASWLSTASTKPGAWTGDQTTTQLTVPAISVQQLLADQLDINQPNPIDLVKLDVEGLELELLTAARSFFPQINHWLIELHPPKHDTGQLETTIRSLLEQNYTQIEIWPHGYGTKMVRAS